MKAEIKDTLKDIKYPLDESLVYIDRCIALANQTVEIRKGEIYVDDQPEGPNPSSPQF